MLAQSEGGDLETAAAAAGGNAEATKYYSKNVLYDPSPFSHALHRVKAKTWRLLLLLLEATQRPQNTCSKNVQSISLFSCLHRVRGGDLEAATAAGGVSRV